MKKTFYIPFFFVLILVISIFLVVFVPHAASRDTSQQKSSLITVSFTAGGFSTTTLLSKKSSVYGAMVHLASTTLFRFKATYYSGLGYFIQSINNLKNSHGQYWILYINDKESPIGASNYILKDRDQVEWKYQSD